ncbi:MAG: isochorismatase hydrolase [Solirubrobacterales bacterium]|nr:isochorismatase hydrolase [Solirubrobacterales bacterium]
MTNDAGGALLLLDLQESICRIDGEIGRGGIAAQVMERDVLGAAARALAGARERGLVVAYARLAFDDSYATLASRAPRVRAMREARIGLASSAGSAICDEIAPRAGEPVVSKVGIDPLVGTPLLAVLTAAGVTEIALGGVATNHVVESAARHAADLGFSVTVLEDACAAQTSEFHRHSVEHTLPFYAAIASVDDYLARISA